MGTGDSPACPLLLLRSCLLYCFLRRSLLLGVPLFSMSLSRWRLRLVLFRCCSLLRLGLLFRQLRSLEALAIESDFGNAHSAERLPMSAQLLILLLPFVMKDQDFRTAAFF